MEYTQAEILQTVRMTEMEHLDVRTVTLGLSLRDCAREHIADTAARVREKIERTGGGGAVAGAKFVCFAKAVEATPFRAGASPGVGEPEAVINVGVSGPGV